jgi:hypothetical protein
MGQIMTSQDLSRDLERAILAGLPFERIVSILNEFRLQGVTRQEAYLALEELRGRAPDESVEDRILEVMDIVSGFCSRENMVWDEPVA